MIDFTNCKRVMGRAYNGANGNKIAIEYDGDLYMLKFPPSGKNKSTTLSYTNGCISEHLASSIFNLIGINAQKTMLGKFVVGDKIKLVCACKDFTEDGKRFYDFCSIKNTVIDSDTGGHGTELKDILDTIERQNFVSPSVLRDYFWDVFIVDALLGNFDRHNGNWGFLYDEKTGISEIAPVFDCGSCLLPQADEKIMNDVLNDENELNARIFNFPASIIKINDKKINYYDFITSLDNDDCNKAIKRIVPNINIKEINDFIDSVNEITDLEKSFYKRYINARYDLIIRPALKNI